MPYFRDYETVGEPYDKHRTRDYEATLWRVKNSSSTDGRGKFSVKCIATRQAAPGTGGEAGEKLDADRNLDFVAAFKQVKQALAAGGRGLAPIYDFGVAPEGVWYATDFFERKSLKALVILKGQVDDAILRHVMSSVVAGCLSLQKACGRSHGNLKLSNILLGGHTQALRNTPLLLVDPQPAPASVPDGPNVFEGHDLKALGEIILQLVERRIFESSYDYNLPSEPSAMWARLGKEGENWRKLCLQLLDPQLSLQSLNLARLGAEFKTKSGNSNVVIGAGVVAGLALVGGGFFWYLHSPKVVVVTHPPTNNISPTATPIPVTPTNQKPANPEVLAQVQRRLDRGDYGFANEPDFLALTNHPEFGALLSRAQTEVAELATLAGYQQQTNAPAAANYYQSLNLNKPPFDEIYQWATNQMAVLSVKESNEQADAFAAARQRYADGHYADVLTGLDKWAGTSDYVKLAGQVTAATVELDQVRKALAAGDYATITSAQPLAGSAEFATILAQATAEQGVLTNAQEHFEQGNYGFVTSQDFLALTNKPGFGLLLGRAQPEAAELAKLTSYQQQTNFQAAANYYQSLNLNKPSFNEIYQWATNQVAVLSVKESHEQADAFTAARQRYADGHYADVLTGLDKWAGTSDYVKLAGQVKVATDELDQLRKALAAGDYATITSAQPLAGSAEFATVLALATAEQGVLTNAQEHFEQGNYDFVTSQDFLALTNKPGFGWLLGRAQPEAAELATLASYQKQTNFQAAANYYQSLNLNKPRFNEIYQWATNQVVVSTRKSDAFKLAGQKYDTGDYTNVLAGLTEWSQTSEYSDLASRVKAATDELDQLRKALAAGDYGAITPAQPLAGSEEFKQIQAQAAAEERVLSGAQTNIANGDFGFTNKADFLQLTNKHSFWLVYQQAMAQGAQKEQDYHAKIQAGNVAYGNGDFATAKADASDALVLKPNDAEATDLLHKAQFEVSLQEVKRNFVDDPVAANQNLQILVASKPNDPEVVELQKNLAKLSALDAQLRDLMKEYGIPAQVKINPAIDPAKSPLSKIPPAQQSDSAPTDLDKLENLIKKQYPPEWLNNERNNCYQALSKYLTNVG